jgi:hypothetical protein
MLRVLLVAVATAVRTRDLVPGPVDVRLLAADHEWVAALRWTCSHDRRGAGEGCWFIPFTEGAGIFVNVGRSLRAKDSRQVRDALCTVGSECASETWCANARRHGYASIQVANYQEGNELIGYPVTVLCYGGCMTKNIRGACVPASVPVRASPSVHKSDFAALLTTCTPSTRRLLDSVRTG